MPKHTHPRCWRLLVRILCTVLILQSFLIESASAQNALKVVVVEGQGSKNVSQQIPPRQLIVKVQDGNRPVPQAMVSFKAPSSGPSGDFENDSHLISVATGPDGTASAGVYHPNALVGPYLINVRAEYRGETATTAISQMNIATSNSHKKTMAIVGIVAAAAAAALAARSKGGSTVSPASTIPTITLGGAAVGAPR